MGWAEGSASLLPPGLPAGHLKAACSAWLAKSLLLHFDKKPTLAATAGAKMTKTSRFYRKTGSQALKNFPQPNGKRMLLIDFQSYMRWPSGPEAILQWQVHPDTRTKVSAHCILVLSGRPGALANAFLACPGVGVPLQMHFGPVWKTNARCTLHF
ncbi:MAG: hypothetical protein EOO11_18925 [Chitinophagaceae bacterium]|nr:MAG: hypothetical protein EOO11_18925 [Chitinophagaceae bacterium]